MQAPPSGGSMGVPEVGLEPTRLAAPHFECGVSTDSTIRAGPHDGGPDHSNRGPQAHTVRFLRPGTRPGPLTRRSP